MMEAYYDNLVRLTNEGGCWGGLYYGVFSTVINENGFKKCAEIGIGYGLHAKEILTNTKVDKLYLVDPMQYYPNDAFADDVTKNGGFEELVKCIDKELSPYKKRYKWYRKASLAITEKEIPNRSLDAVFIDADHSYGAVKQDLAFWWNKIRVGGQMLGDDYNSCHPGTTRAVDEFARENNLKVDFLTKPNSTQPGYQIYRFIK